MDGEAWHSVVHRVGHNSATEQQQYGLSRSPFMGPLGMSYGFQLPLVYWKETK